MSARRPTPRDEATVRPSSHRSPARRFARKLASEPLEPRALLASDLEISEFMAANDTTLADEDGDFSDWIEIHNASTAAVSLDGWYLTDNDDNPTKWRLPGESLAPDAYRVVFASGKDRAVAGAPLHTNFKLSGAGEYLALIEPNGATIASEFAPEFPPQVDDVSYGTAVNLDVTELAAPGATAHRLVPTSGALGSSWTAANFDDSTWTAGPTGVGYDAALPGVQPSPPVLYWTLDGSARDSSGNGYDGTLQGPSYSLSFPAKVGAGQSASFDGVNDYVLSPQVTSSFTASDSVTLSVWFNATIGGGGGAVVTELGQSEVNTGWHDSQIEMQASGQVLARVWNLPAVSLGTASFGQWHHAVLRYDQATANLDGFLDGIEAVGNVAGNRDAPWESGYQQIYALGALDSTHLGNPLYFKGTIDDFAVWNAALSNAQIAALWTGSSPLLIGYASLIGSDVFSSMRNVRASIYLRSTFTLGEDDAFDTLKLRMKYDDGFVAYLNGTEVVRRNAPIAPTWTSAAASERLDRLAVVYEDLDLTPLMSLLQTGTNVLAIHGLNDSVSGNDFLILPELQGITAAGVAPRYFSAPTPGAANNDSVFGVVEDTKFSDDRGFYDAPLAVSITTETAGAEIRYTTDGTAPTATHGTVYAGPVAVNTTTTLRAAAFKPGSRPTNVDTQTYIFLDDVLQQTGAGYPTNWNGAPADYAMDADVVDSAAYSSIMRDSMLSIPTMSLVTAPADMFESTGIYSNPGGGGVGWERPASVEMFYPDGREGFQVNAGIRIHGGVSRDPNFTLKHSFRLLFKERYGASKLNYKLFDDSPVDEFDTIILRAHSTDSWTVGEAQPYFGKSDTLYFRDLWMRDAQLAMGSASSHGNYVHLYVNGLYWGLYDPSERPDASFAASYYGGDKSEYDAIRDGEAVDGDRTAWDAMQSMAALGVDTQAEYLAIQQYVDLDNLIDYVILHQYAGAEDWAWHNYTATRRREPAGPYRFHSWDQEITNQHLTHDVSDAGGADNPSYVYQQLRSFPEFRLRVADRVHKFLFNGGVLTPAAAAMSYQALADRVFMPVVAESARWGDSRRDEPYTRDNEWQAEMNRLMTTYFPFRTDVVIQQFRDDGLYPNVVAPSFNQHGGSFSPGFRLTISAPAGTIYYRSDGLDPRVVAASGTVSIRPGTLSAVGSAALTLNSSKHVTSRVLAGGVWSAINEADFHLDLSKLRVTEINYSPRNPDLGEFEFLELKNIGGVPLDLAGVHFTQGIEFAFSSMTLGPGQFVVVAKDPAAFAARYNTAGVSVVGPFIGSLDGAGETLALAGDLNGPVFEFTYNDAWYPITDGGGYTLVKIDPSAAPATWNQASAWRTSGALDGSPGADDVGFVPGSILINELLTNTSDVTLGDRIELANATAAPLNLGGWYLSDSPLARLKFQIPSPSTIAAGGFAVFYQFGPGGFGAAFNLAPGSQVYLTSPGPGGTAGGYQEGTSFLGEAAPEVSLGRYATSTGRVDFTALASQSFGAANGAPRIGPIAISEVHYHPAGAEDEFIELVNPTASPVALFDPAHPANTWQVRGAIDYSLPTGVSISAGGFALIVPIDPATFRTRYGVPMSVPIVGPYTGALGNGGESVDLYRPGEPAGPFVPLILVDRVEYDDDAPWPLLADGGGPALMRLSATAYGNDVANWGPTTVGGTPGRANLALDLTPPTAPTLLQVTPIGVTRSDLTWQASIDAESGVDHYRVFRDGLLIGTADTASFSDVNVAPGMAHTYYVSAVNRDSFESAASEPVTTLALLNAISPASNKVHVLFSEPVAASAAQIGHYAIAGLSVLSATLAADQSTVVLTTSPLALLNNYTLIVNGIVTPSGKQLAPGSSAAFRTADIASDLLMHLPLDDGSGMTAADVSGGNHHAALVNMDEAEWVSGRIGGGLDFDGANDYLDLALDVSESDYSLSLWFKTSAETTGVYVVSAGALGANGFDRLIYLTGGHVAARVWNNETIVTSGPSFADGRWHHLAHVLGGAIGGQQIYVDGVLLATGSKASSDFNWQDRVDIGFANDAGGLAYFRGQLDDVRVYSRALSQSDVLALAVAPLSIESVGSPTPKQVQVLFTDPVDPQSAGVATNYSIPGAAVLSAALAADGRTVTLTTTALVPGTSYTLTVAGVQSLSGQPLGPGSQRTFMTADVASDLLAWYPLDETSGFLAGDRSGGGHTASLVNMTSADWVAGYSAGALDFDGVNDFVDVALDVSESAYSLSLWFRTTVGTTGIYSVSSGQLGGGGHDRHVYLSGGNIATRVWSDETIVASGDYADGNWHHVAHVFGGAAGGQRIYVDGQLKAGGGKSFSDFDWQDRVEIGFSNDAGGGAFFLGQLDDVRIYSRALAAGDVQALSAGALLGRVFDDDDGDGLQDAGEGGIAGAPVTLYSAGADGQISPDDVLIGATASDPAGDYIFGSLPPGPYYVQFTAPPPLSFSPANQGASDLVDSDAEELTGRTGVFAVQIGVLDTTRDAGLREVPATVVARRVFYNNSSWDGNNSAATPADDAAIATDKAPLLPGGTATLANYTSFSKGLNGIMLDVQNVGGTLTAADFAFKTGNVIATNTWTVLATAPSISLRPGAGTGGSTRVTLTWPDGAIKKQWLQVTMLATANTRLASPDVFYFGNAIGESGNSAGDAQVNAADELAARGNPRNIANPAPITFRFDYNRDKQVNAADQLISRGNPTNLASRLLLITPTAGVGGPAGAGLAEAALGDAGLDDAIDVLARRGRRL